MLKFWQVLVVAVVIAVAAGLATEWAKRKVFKPETSNP